MMTDMEAYLIVCTALKRGGKLEGNNFYKSLVKQFGRDGKLSVVKFKHLYDKAIALRDSKINKYPIYKKHKRKSGKRAPKTKRDFQQKYGNLMKLWKRQNLHWGLDTCKDYCRKIVQVAHKAGIIAKPTICPRCGEEYEIGQIHGHHLNYRDPLDIIWLCAKCHAAEHAELRSMGY